MSKKVLLFDLDNTLLDFDVAEEKGLKEVFETYGITYNEKNIQQYKNVNQKLWKAYEKGEITTKEITDNRFSLFFEAVGIEKSEGLKAEILYRHVIQHSKVEIPGAKELLEELKGHYQIGLITNGLKETQRSRLKITGLEKYFNEVFVSAEMGFQKPEIEFFEIVKKAFPDVSPLEMLIIGDSLTSDIQGGINAGIDTVWLNRRNEASNHASTYEITELNQLTTILKKIS